MPDTQVFISYARADVDKARRLYSDLKKVGLSPWLDEESLLPGQRWQPAIREAIKNSRYFIPLLSTNSVMKRGFVQKEFKAALDVLDEFPESDIYIIPVRLDGCEITDKKLGEIHRVDMFPDWDKGINRILQALRIERGLPSKQLRKEILPYQDAEGQQQQYSTKREADLRENDAHKKDADIRFSKGQSLLKARKYEEALECYEKALEIYPEYKQAWKSKGEALFCLRKSNEDEETRYTRYNKALECYNKALEIDPVYIDAWFMKAGVFITWQKYEESLQCYDKILQIDPNNYKALSLKCFNLGSLSRWQQARECYDRALSINPKDASMLSAKGQDLEVLKRNEEALEYYEKALSIDPQKAASWEGKARMLRSLFGLQRYEEARECEDKAEQLRKRRGYYFDRSQA